MYVHPSIGSALICFFISDYEWVLFVFIAYVGNQR